MINAAGNISILDQGAPPWMAVDRGRDGTSRFMVAKLGGVAGAAFRPNGPGPRPVRGPPFRRDLALGSFDAVEFLEASAGGLGSPLGAGAACCKIKASNATPLLQ